MTPQPDFLRPARQPRRLAWSACATALAVLAVTALDAQDAWQLRQSGPSPARPARAAAAAPPPAQAVRAETDARRLALQALARLQRPWPAIFSTLEAAGRPGITWLELEISDNGRLRLTGQTATAGDALAAAAGLRRTGLWQDAIVGTLDAASAPADAPLRFEITAGPAQ